MLSKSNDINSINLSDNQQVIILVIDAIYVLYFSLKPANNDPSFPFIIHQLYAVIPGPRLIEGHNGIYLGKTLYYLFIAV